MYKLTNPPHQNAQPQDRLGGSRVDGCLCNFEGRGIRRLADPVAHGSWQLQGSNERGLVFLKSFFRHPSTVNQQQPLVGPGHEKADQLSPRSSMETQPAEHGDLSEEEELGFLVLVVP